jgi:hypothetical protein
VGKYDLSVDAYPFELLSAFTWTADFNGKFCGSILDQIVRRFGAPSAL